MSLNRALAELFKVVREEAAGNPAFALKLEEALSVYRPSKALKQAAKARLRPKPAAPAPAEPVGQEEPAAPGINPISIYTNQGEAALRMALAAPSRAALAALVEEHNLDPAGQADGADRDGLVEQIVAQAKKRVERDSKLFDY
ncbi:MAG TPA: hypothetical protein VG735_03990 [Caulobacterales bacterium]|jgi:hypothetical protein|nr:hypothetical protein [Caulobacterales bacterium]